MSETERAKWNARYAGGGAPGDPSALVVEIDDLLPRRGRALDVAGGGGRHAVWLAQRGLDVTVADISQAGLELARSNASAAGVSIETLEIDFESDPFPEGPWDLILCFHYLWRPMFEIVARVLAPGGVFVMVHPTRSNLERHPKPGPSYLLDDGELEVHALRLEHGLRSSPPLKIALLEEGWLAEGRHEARLVARRPAP